MATKTNDEKTQDLIREVKKRKAEIAASERPQWKTNCVFSYNGGSLEKSVNLHVETNIGKLVELVAFLRQYEASYISAVKELDIEAPLLSWGGFTANEWVEDVKTRLNKLQISAKRQSLEVLETRLNKIISPELRQQMELDAISEELK